MENMTSDFYTTIAEVTVALSALAGLLVIFKDDVIEEQIIERLERFIRFSLFIAGGSFVPFIVARSADMPLLKSFISTSSDVWMYCSLAYCVIVMRLMFTERRLLKQENSELVLARRLYIGSFFIVILGFVNAFTWQHELPFMLSISWALFVVATRFLVLLKMVTSASDTKKGSNDLSQQQEEVRISN